MARPKQGSDRRRSRLFLWVSLCMTLPLAACGSKGFSLESAVPDTLTTGTVSGALSPASDEWTIRNAVSSAIVDEIGENGLGWANVASGSRGTIRNLTESRDGDTLCRDFTTTLESFEGVFLYDGRACMERSKVWTLHRFEKVG
ncbi:outer membrane surface antigen [Aminobacter sp. J44]|nr:outer membrane surface antigen [Aminobacter sp. J44]